MKQRLAQIIFQILIVVTLFSFWAAFALTVVNKLFYSDLPGYTIGRICIWEFVALGAAFLISKLMIKKWGNLELRLIENEWRISLNINYGIYFSIYFLIAIIVGAYQFYLFSQGF